MRLATTTAAFVLSFTAGVSADDARIAPDWTLDTADGRPVNLQQEVREQTTIIFFWATWCPYCKALMPHLQSIRLEYGDDVEIIAISIKEDGDPVAFVANAGYDFTLLPEGDDVAELYGVTGTPGVFIVDQDRTIQFDLRSLPRIDPPATGKPVSNGRKAAYRAPYWAAEIRKHLDTVFRKAAR
jgi:thiol-disulfide isomerase/thioredoxin